MNETVGSAERLASSWGVPVIVENVPGANGNIGNERVAKGPTDGTQLLVVTTNIVTSAEVSGRDANDAPFLPALVLRVGFALIVTQLLQIVGLILAGRFLIRPLFRLIGLWGEREMFIVAALFTIAAAATSVLFRISSSPSTPVAMNQESTSPGL